MFGQYILFRSQHEQVSPLSKSEYEYACWRFLVLQWPGWRWWLQSSSESGVAYEEPYQLCERKQNLLADFTNLPLFLVVQESNFSFWYLLNKSCLHNIVLFISKCTGETKSRFLFQDVWYYSENFSTKGDHSFCAVVPPLQLEFCPTM